MLSRVVQVLQLLRRKAVQRPRITGLVAVFLLTALPYFILWRLHMGKFGRWYWNYGVAIHPIMVSLLPSGDWGGVGNPPRWVQEIHDSPWMGEWPMPLLTKPKYDEHGKLTSPVIAKLHIFSTVQEKARQKRKLIRQLTVLDQIPEEYRHLIEIKFVMGHAYKENWEVDQEMEDLLKLEQEEHGDLIRLSLVHGENLREGKILDWMHAAGSGEDGGRPGWWTFKVDDDVSGGVVRGILELTVYPILDCPQFAKLSRSPTLTRPPSTDIPRNITEPLASFPLSLHRIDDGFQLGSREL